MMSFYSLRNAKEFETLLLERFKSPCSPSLVNEQNKINKHVLSSSLSFEQISDTNTDTLRIHRPWTDFQLKLSLFRSLARFQHSGKRVRDI